MERSEVVPKMPEIVSEGNITSWGMELKRNVTTKLQEYEHGNSASLVRDNEAYEEIIKIQNVLDIHTKMLCKLFEIANIDTTGYLDDIKKSKVPVKPKWAN